MEALQDWSALQHVIGAIRRGGPGYTTNLYASREQLATWSAAASLRALILEGAVLVLRADRDFHHVYHVAESPSALTAALRQLPPGIYTTDLIGREDRLQHLCAAYADADFAHRAILLRMTRPEPSIAPDLGDALQASPDDVPAIAALLERLLDHYIEQIPSENELHEAVGNGQVFIVRNGAGLAGMLMYDLKGQLAHLRFWHVDQGARSAGVGRRLMASFLARCECARRIVLWVIGDNDRSIAIYRHYGFETDGLIDRIMILHKERFP